LILVNTEGELAEVLPEDGSVAATQDLKTPLSQPPIVAGGVLYLLADDGRITAWR
jgi:outer membrane protein assembly factor BamB